MYPRGGVCDRGGLVDGGMRQLLRGDKTMYTGVAGGRLVSAHSCSMAGWHLLPCLGRLKPPGPRGGGGVARSFTGGNVAPRAPHTQVPRMGMWVVGRALVGGLQRVAARRPSVRSCAPPPPPPPPAPPPAPTISAARCQTACNWHPRGARVSPSAAGGAQRRQQRSNTTHPRRRGWRATVSPATSAPSPPPRFLAARSLPKDTRRARTLRPRLPLPVVHPVAACGGHPAPSWTVAYTGRATARERAGGDNWG